MGCCTLTRASIVRILFAIHGIVAIWRLYVVSLDIRYWYLSGALVGLLLETMITFSSKKGHEWKWFCPSVFFYLLSVVPAIWFLELIELEKRIAHVRRFNGTEIIVNDTDDGLFVIIPAFSGIKLEIRLPIHLSSEQWIKTIEQLLLLLLIIGRWILPKGKLTHDQLSQLLLVYIGTAADIVEFFDAFKEDKVRFDRKLCMIILSLWSWSLLQFAMVLTAARARKDKSGLLTKKLKKDKPTCCMPDVYGIVISIFMQDAPFLVLRLLLIFKYEVVSYTNMFFTSKNTLVIILLIYRLVVVQCTIRKMARKRLSDVSNEMRESNSRTQLVRSFSFGDQVGHDTSPVNWEDYRIFPRTVRENRQKKHQNGVRSAQNPISATHHDNMSGYLLKRPNSNPNSRATSPQTRKLHLIGVHQFHSLDIDNMTPNAHVPRLSPQPVIDENPDEILRELFKSLDIDV